MPTKKQDIIRSAGGVVIRKTPKGFAAILLYKNSHWVLPKGRIEKGESDEEAALREVFEETQIPVKKIKLLTRLGKLNYFVSKTPKTVSYFLMQTSQKDITPIFKEGFKKAEWFLLEEALNKATFPESKGIILKAIKYFEKSKKIDTVAILVGGDGKRMGKIKGSKLLLKVNGEPFLKHLMCVLLKKFNKIYLLTGYHKKSIEFFIKNEFRKDLHKIGFIYGGIQGGGRAIYKAQGVIKKPFLCVDGNVICNSRAVKDISVTSQSLIRLLVSKKSLINTHLHILSKKEEIRKMIPVVNIEDRMNKKRKLFCSLGVVAIDNRLFKIVPDISRFYDFDTAMYTLFKTRPDIKIDFLPVKDDWFCLHTQDDLDYMGSFGKRFSVLYK